MNQEDIFRLIIEERIKQGVKRADLDKKAGTVSFASIHEVLNGKGITVGLLNIIKILDALNFQVSVEDKGINWGLDTRLRRMPKTLYVGERIESRAIKRQDGFHARVDLYETPEVALKFITQPCDVYEIHPHDLIRKHFDVIDHPYGTIYSYNDWISPDFIENRVTYR